MTDNNKHPKQEVIVAPSCTGPFIVDKFKAAGCNRGIGLFILASDSSVYFLGGEPSQCYFIRCQQIRKGLTLAEIANWEQYVDLGLEVVAASRWGVHAFRSNKKAINALETGQLKWSLRPYMHTDRDREKDWEIRTQPDFMPRSMERARQRNEAPSKLGLVSLDPPWLNRELPILTLVDREGFIKTDERIL